MLLKFLRSKIHGAKVTEANINYIGSIAIDTQLMEAAGLKTSEIVMVADVENGNRLMTYVIPAPAGSKTICLNGAAARLVSVGDTVLVFSFAYLTEEEAARHRARIVLMGEDNEVKEIFDQ